MARCILLVDDNPMDLEFVSYVLTTKGYIVRTAPSVEKGLDLMKEFTPCLIISDLNLPHRGGLEFLKKIKEAPRWKDIPFVLISATSNLKSDVDRGHQMGADKFVFRPIEPQALLDELGPYLKGCSIS